MTAQRYRKKPVEIDAYQWFEVSPYVEGVKRDVDYFCHPPVDPQTGEVSAADNAILLGELKHSDPAVPERFRREGCDHRFDEHGYIDTLEGGHTVCPGDWIITGVQGEKYPCKPDIFAATYNEVTGPRGIDLEIVEPVRDQDDLDRANRVGVIVPRSMRINGSTVAWPADQPPIIEKLTVDGSEAAVVTLTLFARSVSVRAEVVPDADH
jgi:hypothetical protein